MQLTEFRVRRRTVFTGSMSVGLPGQQHSLNLFDIFASNPAIAGRWNQERKTAGPYNRVEIMPDLTDVFRFFVITSRYSESRVFSFLLMAAPYFRGCALSRLRFASGLHSQPLMIKSRQDFRREHDSPSSVAESPRDAIGFPTVTSTAPPRT